VSEKNNTSEREWDAERNTRTSFSSSLKLAYSCPASFAACATLSLRLLFACCRWIQSVKYSCHAEGASFGGRRTLFSGAARRELAKREE
jgi:hypothetical protein